MIKHIFPIIISTLLVTGCTAKQAKLPGPPKTVAKTQNTQINYGNQRKFSLRSRNSVPVEKTRYEGSLWRGESSWGNLLRDHRARFRNDVLTITNLQQIINIPEEEPKPIVQQPLIPEGEGQAAQAAAALEAANAAAGIVDVEKERNDVLRSFTQISAQVIDVLPNGNMIILGEKVDYRQQNSVRYITKIRGIIRPEDVSPTNTISSLMLARSEVNTKRQVQAGRINISALAPLLGTQKSKLASQISRAAAGRGGTQNTAVPTTQ
ncbi:MAG: flagellar basal body L-ring protein FlgH [Proteobacteria bacterium]|nr:flagellar basal body L-ring protein FlgH [Pseudomonadota bacterium]